MLCLLGLLCLLRLLCLRCFACFACLLALSAASRFAAGPAIRAREPHASRVVACGKARPGPGAAPTTWARPDASAFVRAQRLALSDDRGQNKPRIRRGAFALGLTQGYAPGADWVRSPWPGPSKAQTLALHSARPWDWPEAATLALPQLWPMAPNQKRRGLLAWRGLGARAQGSKGLGPRIAEPYAPGPRIRVYARPGSSSTNRRQSADPRIRPSDRSAV